MSENPNPVVCGSCQTENPPGAEYCSTCGVALTMAAELGDAEVDEVRASDPGVDSANATDPAETPFPTD